jgi:hypothetical protein
VRIRMEILVKPFSKALLLLVPHVMFLLFCRGNAVTSNSHHLRGSILRGGIPGKLS